MVTNEVVYVGGYWENEPKHTITMCVSLGSWDGEEDSKDEEIFYYMDGEPLAVGCVIADGFVVTNINRGNTILVM